MHRSPGNSSPKLSVGDESGFFVFIHTMSEFDILSSAFSQHRLNKYLLFHNGDKEKAMQHYKFNIYLSQAMYTSLSVFEVTLRNALSNELQIMSKDVSWIDTICQNPNLLDFHSDIDHAIKQISNRHEPVTVNKVIAELNLGFWVMLLNSKYENILWKHLRKAFPNLPKKDRKRKTVSRICNLIRNFRNRIFHNEAICWNLEYVKKLHGDLVEAVSWINKDVASWLVSIDKFDSVCAEIDI